MQIKCFQKGVPPLRRKSPKVDNHGGEAHEKPGADLAPQLARGTSTGAGGSTLSLLDPKRANNLSIILSRSKLSFEQMRKAVLELNAEARARTPTATPTRSLAKPHPCPKTQPSAPPSAPPSALTRRCPPMPCAHSSSACPRRRASSSNPTPQP